MRLSWLLNDKVSKLNYILNKNNDKGTRKSKTKKKKKEDEHRKKQI